MPWITDIHVLDIDGGELGNYELEKDLVYKYLGETYITPAGNTNDFSSFPWFIKIVIPTSLLAKAPFLLKYLYKFQPFGTTNLDRKLADQLYLVSAIDEGMDEKVAKILYYGLRIGGWVSWKNYTKENH